MDRGLRRVLHRRACTAIRETKMDELDNMDLADTTEADGPQIHLESWLATLENANCHPGALAVVVMAGALLVLVVGVIYIRLWVEPTELLTIYILAVYSCRRDSEKLGPISV